MNQTEHVESEQFADFANFSSNLSQTTQSIDAFDFEANDNFAEFKSNETTFDANPSLSADLTEVKSLEDLTTSIEIQRCEEKVDQNTKEEEDDDDDWGDEWASAEPITSTEAPAVIPNESTTLINDNSSSVQSNENVSLNGLEKMFKDSFTLQSDHDASLHEAATLLHTLFVDATAKLIWENIQSLDESPSLKMKWKETHSFQKFLASINIKSVNTNTDVPIFASSLRLLQPTKVSIPPSNGTISNLPQTTQTVSNSRSIEINKNQEVFTNNLHSSKSSFSSPDTTEQEQKVISSELNAIKANHSSTEQTLKSNDNGNTVNALTMKTPTTSVANDCKMNPEVSKILDELPILSFMRSNVLMFPIKDDS